MDRLRNVSGYWSWLPAFRAIAETEHLPSAAEAMRLSPSALSRSLHLLEQHLGRPLFRRVGRSLERNAAGDRLLDALRDAMRAIDRAANEVRDELLFGPIRVACASVLMTPYVLPAMRALQAEFPNFLPVVESADPVEVPRLLRRGDLELAILDLRLRAEGLSERPLGRERSSIWCGPGHPLHAEKNVRLEEILIHEFVAPPPGQGGLSDDGWPVGIERKIGMHVDQMRVGLELCAKGEFLAVLPDLLVHSSGGPELRRLPLDIIPKIPIFAYYVRDSAASETPRVLLRAVAEQLEQSAKGGSSARGA